MGNATVHAFSSVLASCHLILHNLIGPDFLASSGRYPIRTIRLRHNDEVRCRERLKEAFEYLFEATNTKPQSTVMHVSTLIVFSGFLSVSWSFLLPRCGFVRRKAVRSSFQRNTEKYLLEQPNVDSPFPFRGTNHQPTFEKRGIVGPDTVTDVIPDIFKRVSTGIDETSMGTLPTLPQMAGCALIGGVGAMIATHDANVAGIFALIILLIAFLDHSLVYRLRDVGSATFYLFAELLFTLGLLVKWVSYTAYQNSPLPNQFQLFVANNDAIAGISAARASAAHELRPDPPNAPELSTVIAQITAGVETRGHANSQNPKTTPSGATNSNSLLSHFRGYREERSNVSQPVAATTNDRMITTPKPILEKEHEVTTKGLHQTSTKRNATVPVNESIEIVSPYIPLVRMRKQSVSSLTAPVPTKTTLPPRSNSSVSPAAVKQSITRSPTSSPPKEKKVSPSSSNDVVTSVPTKSNASPSSIPSTTTAQQERKSIDWAAVHRSGSEIYKMMQHQHASSPPSASSPVLSSSNTANKPA